MAFFALKCAAFMAEMALPNIIANDNYNEIKLESFYEYVTAFFYYGQFAQATAQTAIDEWDN